MGTPREIKVDTLDGFLAESRPKSSDRKYLFRGVDNRSHNLTPSVARTRKRGTYPAISVDEERLALERFRDQVRPHVGHTIGNDLEWLIVAQHHGLPTRLLDWTYSPLVAAYFAVKTIEGTKMSPSGEIDLIDGAVHAVPRPEELRLSTNSDPFAKHGVRTVEPPHVSERVPRQMSVLTLHEVPTDPWEPVDAVLFVFPNQQKLKVKFELDQLGFNEASLFPGIDGAAAYLRWRMKWNRLMP